MGRGRKLEDLEVRACKDGECAKSTRMAVTGRIDHAALELGDSVNCYTTVCQPMKAIKRQVTILELWLQKVLHSIRLKQTSFNKKNKKHFRGIQIHQKRKFIAVRVTRCKRPEIKSCLEIDGFGD